MAASITLSVAPATYVTSNVKITTCIDASNAFCLATEPDTDEYLRHAPVFAHGVGTEVTVRPGAVPIARDGLGVEADDDTIIFGNALQQETAHPEVITHLDALA